MSQNAQNFMDKMAAKADELELQRKATELADAVGRLAQSAFEQAKTYTADHRDSVEGFLDKAAAKVDEQTDGKYHDKVAKARGAASEGLSKFAGTTGGAASAEAPAAEPTFPTEPAGGVGTEENASPEAWKDATDGGPKG
jgi:hypothetical protein